MIATGESSHVAIAPELPDDESIGQTLSAFANTRGGWLLIGAVPEGEVIGSRDCSGDMSRIRLVAEEDLKPALGIELNTVRVGKANVITVHVNTSDNRPHSMPAGKKGRAEIFVRVGETNELADGATLNALRSHRVVSSPKSAFEEKILEWVAAQESDGQNADGGVSPADFSQAANVGERRANKAFIQLETNGLLIGHGERGRRFYALP